jgi:hypothetical protein
VWYTVCASIRPRREEDMGGEPDDTRAEDGDGKDGLVPKEKDVEKTPPREDVGGTPLQTEPEEPRKDEPRELEDGERV